MAKGKLIILEAGDGSGKATQTQMLYDRLVNEGRRVHKIDFPDYDSDSSALVKMYLNGDFGSAPEDVNAYVASTFFAVDRFASFRMKWKQYYDAGDIILLDRYTESNMVHQGVKIEDPSKRDDFIVWLWDLEYVRMGLPLPSEVVFLDMEPEVEARLLARRARENGQSGDIHEKDLAYLKKCHAEYLDSCKRYGWKRVICSENGQVRDPSAIHQDIYETIRPILKEEGDFLDQ